MTKVKRVKSFAVHWISFVVFASPVWKVLKKAIAELNICRENFCGSLKIRENREALTFIIYGTVTLLSSFYSYTAPAVNIFRA